MKRSTAKNLMKRLEKTYYAHNCPKRVSGFLNPVSEKLIESPLCTEDAVIEYLEKYIEEPMVLVKRHPLGLSIYEVEWSNEPIYQTPSFRLKYNEFITVEIIFEDPNL